MLLEEPICGVALGFSFRSSEKQEDGIARSTKLNWEKKRPPEALLLGVVSLFAGAALQPFQVIGLKDNLLIGGDVHHHAGPVGMDLAGLLDEDVIENIIGNAVSGIGLHDGGVGQGLVIGQLHALVVEVEAAAHPAAVQTGVFRDLLQIVQDLVRLVEVFGSGGSVVKAELDVGAGKLADLEAAEAAAKKAEQPDVEVEPQLTETVDFDTFCKSDFRVVKVKACEAVKKSDKLLRFTLDDGTGTDRQILSGVHKFYEPEELVGKTLAAIVNLPPRKMMGLESNGMLLSAVHTEKGEEKLNLIMLDDKIPAGSKLC